MLRARDLAVASALVSGLSGCAAKSGGDGVGDASTGNSGSATSSDSTPVSETSDPPPGDSGDDATGVLPAPTPDSTEDPAPESFSRRVVPFFRGRVCMEHSVEAGAPFPVFLEPCLHPCLATSSFQFKHSWSCMGDDCDAFALMWVIASGSGCPTDAFGRFDRSQCSYATSVEFSITPNYPDGTPLVGDMRVEIPFLTNDDAALIEADPENTALRDMLIHKYPPDDNRVPGGMSVNLQPENPPPPDTCGNDGSACTCFDVGF